MRLLFLMQFHFLFSGLFAQSSEADYAILIHAKTGGQREVTVPSGRVDILTDTHAYEIEWANKWKHAIGQALWYALQTNTKPAIVLIMREEKEYKYYIQLNSALDYAELTDNVDVFLYPRDFEE